MTEEIRRQHPLAVRCSSCGASIVWFRTRAGKRMPVDEASTQPTDAEHQLDLKRHRSHFACPSPASPVRVQDVTYQHALVRRLWEAQLSDASAEHKRLMAEAAQEIEANLYAAGPGAASNGKSRSELQALAHTAITKFVNERRCQTDADVVAALNALGSMTVTALHLVRYGKREKLS